MALIAMTLFHFGWDLEMFGFVERGFASQPAMIWFARCIASSFLFLVGYSLVLAHFPQFKWNGFLKRFVMVGAAAAIITIATYFATPDIFIFFGILHHIALASLIGLLFLRLPAIANFIAAIGVLILFAYGRSSFFDAPWWWWSGLNDFVPRSSDYVPIFPFFAAVLFGITSAKLIAYSALNAKLSALSLDNKPAKLLKFLGRNSLIYYLVHQPILIAFLYVIHLVTR
jgi:uncharacterized membrane protein